jgi:20S proteasome subunit alpha 3
MSRRYDQSTTTFSPEGRLHQVEYAIEAINNAGTCVGIVCPHGEGIVLVAEKRVVSKLLAPSKISEKTYPIDNHMCCLVAGFSSDAAILIQQARVGAQRYLYSYQEPMPVEQTVKAICNHKQSYTQFGGLRPFGVAFLFAGYDIYNGFQLYQTDPSGNYSGWKATVIGQNNQAGKALLKTDYTTTPAASSSSVHPLTPTIHLAIRILLKTMDSSTPDSSRIELTLLTKAKTGNNAAEVTYVTVGDAEVQQYLSAVVAEDEKKKKSESSTSSDI